MFLVEDRAQLKYILSRFPGLPVCTKLNTPFNDGIVHLFLLNIALSNALILGA